MKYKPQSSSDIQSYLWPIKMQKNFSKQVRDGKSEDSKTVWEWDNLFALNKPLTEIL